MFCALTASRASATSVSNHCGRHAKIARRRVRGRIAALPPARVAATSANSQAVVASSSLTMGALTADTAPTREALAAEIASTATAKRLRSEEAQWAEGAGPPHTNCKLRLFGQSEDKVRVTLYRDTAAWCPYCQKVWMMLEEKQIPYKIEKINMRSYGDKPAWFLQKVPSGLLPVVEIDGEMVTESIVIMQILEANFEGPRLCPAPGTPEFDEANALLKLERQLFGDWCNLIFRPSGGMGGLFGGGAKASFEKTLDKVEAALAVHPDSPWLLGGDAPSLVDMQYISHVERMLASCLYWKGMQLRKMERFPLLENWLDAFEQRPSYQATKSDYYTHVKDIPPQYGPGYADDGAQVEAATRAIGGLGSSWRLPLDLQSPGALEPLSPHMDPGEEVARHEAAYKLLSNLDAIVRFCCRAVGRPGAKRFGAQLADPYAEPDMAWEAEVDVMLRHVISALVSGSALEGDAAAALTKDMGAEASNDRAKLASCLAYLRDRVGVPRDMSFPAAMQLRAHLNWAIDALSTS